MTYPVMYRLKPPHGPQVSLFLVTCVASFAASAQLATFHLSVSYPLWYFALPIASCRVQRRSSS